MANIPQPQHPLVNDQGIVDSVWFQFFNKVNWPTGRVTAVTAVTVVTVTNALVNANSRVFALASSLDTTGVVTAVIPGAGLFNINVTAPTAPMTIDYIVVN